MAKTQGSIIELIDKNLRAWRSHFSFREEFSFIYAKICKKQKGGKMSVLYCSSRQASTMCNFLRLKSKTCFVCGCGAEREVAKSHPSHTSLCLRDTLK